MRASAPRNQPLVTVTTASRSPGEAAQQPALLHRRSTAALTDTLSVSDLACPLTVTHRDMGEAWVVHLTGEADLSTQTTLAGALSLALSSQRNTVVLDVSGLTFCDSTCVLAVIHANREGRLVLAGHTGMVSRVFQLLDPGHTVSRHR